MAEPVVWDGCFLCGIGGVPVLSEPCPWQLWNGGFEIVRHGGERQRLSLLHRQHPLVPAVRNIDDGCMPFGLEKRDHRGGCQPGRRNAAACDRARRIQSRRSAGKWIGNGRWRGLDCAGAKGPSWKVPIV